MDEKHDRENRHEKKTMSRRGYGLLLCTLEPRLDELVTKSLVKLQGATPLAPTRDRRKKKNEAHTRKIAAAVVHFGSTQSVTFLDPG